MYFEADARTLEWLEMLLAHPTRQVRLDGLRLLSSIECGPKEAWLARVSRDRDPEVAASAVIVQALAQRCASAGMDLFESDFADGDLSGDLKWEWEYHVAVCQGMLVPKVHTLVWTGSEDDAAARRLAVLKRCPGEVPDDVVAVIVDKRFVTVYTRSPRNHLEARAWHDGGRPRYRDG